MLRIGASSHGESKLRMLRVVRRGDRHDARDLTVSCTFEGDFASAFVEGHSAGLLPGEAIKGLVHAIAREHGGAEVERFGLALCDRLLTGHPRVTRARVEIAEQPWSAPRGRRQGAGAGVRRSEVPSAAPPPSPATANRSPSCPASISSRSCGRRAWRRRAASRAPRPIPAVATTGSSGCSSRRLSARWTYTSPDVTFDPYRQGVRAAIVETFGCHASRSIQHTLYAIADVVLSSYEDISDITLSLQERPYRPVDLFREGIENPDDLFVARGRTRRRRRGHGRAASPFRSIIGSSFCAASSVLSAGRSVFTSASSRPAPCRAAPRDP